MSKKVLLTGASSFTGFHFCQNLVDKGFEVWAPLTGNSVEDYKGLKKARLEKLKDKGIHFIGLAPMGSPNFIKFLTDNTFDTIGFHGAYVEGYNRADFPVEKALSNNTHNIEDVFEAIKKNSPKIVLTGSYAEGGVDYGTVSPYGESKKQTTDCFKKYCEKYDLPLFHFVITNPFGTYEEPRLGTYVLKNWREGLPIEIRTPDYIRDNIPVSSLAEIYTEVLERPSGQTYSFEQVTPSGYVERMDEFVARMAEHVKAQTQWPCQFSSAKQTDFSQPLKMYNPGPKVDIKDQFWSDYIDYYKEKQDLEANGM